MTPRPSADFRERLVAACDAGLPASEAARLFRVDLSTVYRWRRRARRGESLVEKPRSGRPPKLDPARYPELRTVVLAQPDATLPEHGACGALGGHNRHQAQPVASESTAASPRLAAQKSR